MIRTVHTREGQYDIISGSGLIKQAARYFTVSGRCLVVTDTGVPPEYAECVAAQFDADVLTLPEGEQNKNITSLQTIWTALCQKQFGRGDTLIAVGGGVVGDITGFAAATYMRGIDFYNVPTTVLSQVDSSVGGKTAIDFDSYKNIVGAFWQPKGVLIDTDVLATLDRRQTVNGLIEALKMGVTSDASLVELFEGDIEKNLADILTRAIDVKIGVVERDEKESGERRVLNFGHTVGHAIESTGIGGNLLHGECVGLGMLAMASAPVRQRVRGILQKLGAPYTLSVEPDKLTDAVLHDKKKTGEKIMTVFVSDIGHYELIPCSIAEIQKSIEVAYE